TSSRASIRRGPVTCPIRRPTSRSPASASATRSRSTSTRASRGPSRGTASEPPGPRARTPRQHSDAAARPGEAGVTPGSSAQGRFSLRSIGPVAALLSGAAVLGQVFGLGRELFVANQVGTSPELDALLIAAVFPGLFGSLLASATSTAIVPAYVALERSDGEEVARRMTGSLIGWIGLAALVATVLLVSLGRELTSLAGPGLSPEAAEV